MAPLRRPREPPADLLHIKDGTPFRLAGEQFRLLAATSAFAAGMAQKRAVRELEG